MWNLLLKISFSVCEARMKNIRDNNPRSGGDVKAQINIYEVKKVLGQKHGNNKT